MYKFKTMIWTIEKCQHITKKHQQEKCQQNFSRNQWLKLCWYCVDIKILKFYTVNIVLKLCWNCVKVFWVCTIYKFTFYNYRTLLTLSSNVLSLLSWFYASELMHLGPNCKSAVYGLGSKYSVQYFWGVINFVWTLSGN